MNDSRIFQFRNGLLISFALLALAVMWANVIGLAGALSVVAPILLVLNIAALLYFMKATGFDTLLTTPLPMVLVGLLVVGSLARFVYAMAYGD
ncbi:MAG TPA: hypothetical protein VNT79_04930 [Phycisphaerae bacterium]|nr:hypothetical protein [Phycisphaerae bacterium]